MKEMALNRLTHMLPFLCLALSRDKSFLLPICLIATGLGLLITGLYAIGDGSKGPNGILCLFPISGLLFGSGLCLLADRG